MKKIIPILTVVIGLVILYYFSVSALKCEVKTPNRGNAVEITSSLRDTFTNCIFNSSFYEINHDWHSGEQLNITKNLGRYKELNFNAVQSYDDPGWDIYGKSDADLTGAQKNNFRDFLDSVKNIGNLYGFFERSYISKYCYGQRLRYEIARENGNQTENLGFVYKTREKGAFEMDGNRTVVHAIPVSPTSAGYICKDIYENLQHSDLFNFRQNDRENWFIKPVMRIPKGMNDGISVVRIDVIAFNGSVVKSIEIKTDNFKDSSFNYYGSYLEKYFRLQIPLEISGNTSPTSLNSGRNDDWQSWNANCKVDFRVYWYGTCEVWFDEMIVDDQVANDLFNHDKQPEINSRIQQEVTEFTNYGSLYTFFTDEIFISQYPCIKYVVDKMREYNPSARFSIAVTNNGAIIGLRNDLIGYKIYLDSLKPNFLQDDHHGFQSWSQLIPKTVPISDSRIPPTWIASSNDTYNDDLQNKTIGGKTDAPVDNYVGSLIYEIRTVRDDITRYSPLTKFIMQPQIHGWINTDTLTSKFVWGSREPINEEIQVQAMVSIAYGANGLCWFAYNSHTWRNSNQIPIFCMIGLLDPEDGISKRERNCYGQNKWQYVSEMNRKILNWAPTLENINWVEGFSVHQNGANNFFVEDIKSIYRDRNNTFTDNSSCEFCDNIKYWEEGFYNPKDPSDKSKYLLIVNRRCIPESQRGVGDIRMLRIKFKPSELAGYNNWKIKDVNTGQEITFDKNSQGTDGFLYLGGNQGDLGYFNPGEGKLYKLSPVL